MKAEAKKAAARKSEAKKSEARKTGYGWVLVSAVCTATLIAATAWSGDDDKDGAPVGAGRGSSARELADRARQALLNSSSLHVTVEDRSKGAGTSAPSALDLALDREDDCMASVTFGAHGRADIVRSDDRVWMRMDAKLWRTRLPGAEGRAAAKLLKGRYVTGPADDRTLADLASVCDLSALRRQIRDGGTGRETVREGEPTTLDGTRVVPLTTEADGTTSTLYVAAHGTPYALGYTEVSAGAAGARATDTTTRYADYGKPVPVRTPPADASVDVSKLASLGDGTR
ncbi:hypothetical protein [Streptomyces sp. KL116D]|uniref:hypothetical protein n=1 Tax=Streptomyces sp. KL116D TaxID=3045152 RepID=UPI0035584027